MRPPLLMLCLYILENQAYYNPHIRTHIALTRRLPHQLVATVHYDWQSGTIDCPNRTRIGKGTIRLSLSSQQSSGSTLSLGTSNHQLHRDMQRVFHCSYVSTPSSLPLAPSRLASSSTPLPPRLPSATVQLAFQLRAFCDIEHQFVQCLLR